MVRAPAEVIDHSHAGGECLAAARLLVEAVPATKIAWLVIREAKSLADEIEDVIAVEVLVVVSLREGLRSAAVGGSKPDSAELVGEATCPLAQAASRAASGIERSS